MSKSINIQMMREFVITIDGREISSLVSRTRKGVALIEYLILNNNREVPKQRLLNILWGGYANSNPENAMKTLISRVRKMLQDEDPVLAECIVSLRGAYMWVNAPGMHVDMLDIMDIFEMLPREKDAGKRRQMYDRMIRLYKGDLFLTGDIEGGESYEAALHSEYLNAIYEYVELLRSEEDYGMVVEVCRKAQVIDPFDDRLHMEMMQALVDSNRSDEAMKQYREVTDRSQKYLDVEPSEEMQVFYRKIVKNSDSLRFNLDYVRNELKEGDNRRGAYVCSYEVFKDICNLQRFNLERLGCTLFLGLIMLYEPIEGRLDPQREESVQTLLRILQSNLRKGDSIMRFSPTIVAVLLPTVNFTTGNMIMERIRHLFMTEYPNADIPFHYRLGELSKSVPKIS